MSSYRENEHESDDDGAVHAHIGPTKLYVGIFVALLVFTFLTVALSLVHLGPTNLAIAIGIATIKAALVITFFMHLKDDHRFHALVFISAVLFGGVFFAYTFNDTARRGEVDPNSTVPVYGATGEHAPGGAGHQEFRAPPGSGGGAGAGHH